MRIGRIRGEKKGKKGKLIVRRKEVNKIINDEYFKKAKKMEVGEREVHEMINK